MKAEDSDQEQIEEQQVFYPTFKAPIEDEVDDGVSDSDEERKQGEKKKPDSPGAVSKLLNFLNLGPKPDK